MQVTARDKRGFLVIGLFLLNMIAWIQGWIAVVILVWLALIGMAGWVLFQRFRLKHPRGDQIPESPRGPLHPGQIATAWAGVLIVDFMLDRAFRYSVEYENGKAGLIALAGVVITVGMLVVTWRWFGSRRDA